MRSLQDVAMKGKTMNPETHFSDLRKHVDSGGAVSILEQAALDAWEAGNSWEASQYLSYQDLVSSGGLADAP